MTQQACKCNLCHSVRAKAIFQWVSRGSLYAHRCIPQTLQNNVVELMPSKDSSSPGRHEVSHLGMVSSCKEGEEHLVAASYVNSCK